MNKIEMGNISQSAIDKLQADAWEVAKHRIRAKREGIPSLFPKNDEQLYDAVKYYLNIDIPRVKVCPNHVAPFTAFADAYFARNVVAVWKGSRGLGGKSVLLAALALFEAISLGAYVTLLGGSLEQAKRIHSYQTGEDPNMTGAFWGAKNVPKHLLISEPTQYDTRLTNGGRISVLAASQKSTRGPHPSRLRADETDEIKLDILDSALGQPMGVFGIIPHTVLSSTHQYPDGTMTEILLRAEKNKDWNLYQWCYLENLSPNGWLSQIEVDRKKATVTSEMWKTEFELQEPALENRAIMTDKVEAMFRKDLGIFEGKLGEEIEIEPPDAGAKYSTGTDWAKTTDYTDIITWRYDCHPIKLVAYLRIARTAWPIMIGKHNARVKRYGGKSQHDETGIGGVIADYLEVPSKGIIMRGKPRTDLLTNYITGIENGEFIAPLIKSMYNEHKYAKNDDLYGNGHLPDSISAGGLGAIGTRKTGWARGMG